MQATKQELIDFATPKDQNGNPYDVDELREVFDMVKPVTNWKHPIMAKFAGTTEEIYMVKTAIEFFVGGPTRIDVVSSAPNVRGETILQVVFINSGYYMNIGA